MGCGLLKYKNDEIDRIISHIPYIPYNSNIFTMNNNIRKKRPMNNMRHINETENNSNNVIYINRPRNNSLQNRRQHREERKRQQQGAHIRFQPLQNDLHHINSIRQRRVNSRNRFNTNFGTNINRRMNHYSTNNNNVYIRNINTINSIESETINRRARIGILSNGMENQRRLRSSSRNVKDKKKQKNNIILDQLKTNKIDNVNNLHNENKRCCICLQDFKKNDNAIFLPCFHLFHRKCISKWLDNKEICPLCKLNIKDMLTKQQ